MIALRALLKLILLEVVLVNQGKCNEKQYEAGFNAGLSDCKDYENDMLDGNNMKLAKQSDDGDDAMWLEGYIVLSGEVKEGYMFDIGIEKLTEMGKEPMWSCSMDVCKSLNDEDAPWSDAIKSMNITSCPIAAGKYYCANLSLDMSFMNDMLQAEYEGNYEAMLKITEKTDTLSCHMMGIGIVEK